MPGCCLCYVFLNGTCVSTSGISPSLSPFCWVAVWRTISDRLSCCDLVSNSETWFPQCSSTGMRENSASWYLTTIWSLSAHDRFYMSPLILMFFHPNPQSFPWWLLTHKSLWDPPCHSVTGCQASFLFCLVPFCVCFQEIGATTHLVDWTRFGTPRPFPLC